MRDVIQVVRTFGSGVSRAKESATPDRPAPVTPVTQAASPRGTRVSATSFVRPYRVPVMAAIVLLLASCGNPSASVSGTRAARHSYLSARRIWVATIQPNADSAPAYLSRVRIHGSTRAVVYVLAGNNTANCDPGNPVQKATLYALDTANGHTLWTRSTSGPSRCTTAGPVASGGWVYAAGLDGKLHRYNAATGRETTGHGWPEAVTLMPDVEKVADTPVIANGYLYVTTSGFIGDQGHYEGHVVTINLRTGHSAVFNSLCSNIHQLLSDNPGSSNYCPDVQSGFFGRGQAAIEPGTHDIYAVTGNGPWNGRTNWGDSIVKLDPSGSRLLDSYTPTDQAYLAGSDLDLGSTGPAILPAVTIGGRVRHLLVQGGKGPASASGGPAVLRLLNQSNMSGQNGPGHLGGDLQDLPAPGGCEVLTAPAVWHTRQHGTWVFYANDCGAAGYRLVDAGGKPRLRRVWSSSRGGTTPVIHGGVLWIARSGELAAYRPIDGALLWRDTSIGGLHWEYPSIVGHDVFIADQSGHVSEYRLG